MIKSIFIILGSLLFIWFLLPVFSFRIINIGNITGLAVSLVLFFYGIFFRQFNHFVVWFWSKGVGRIVEIVIGACILAIIVLAVMTSICMLKGMSVPKKALYAGPGVQNVVTDAQQEKAVTAGEKEPDNFSDNITAAQLENELQAGKQQVAENIEAEETGYKKTVIVLGCKTVGDRPSLMLEERLQAAYDYLTEHPDINAIVSGGQGEDETMAEADVMFNWLVDKGISTERICKENRSTDTHENLAYCYDILSKQALNAQKEGISFNAARPAEADGDNAAGQEGICDEFNVVLVTNEFHEYRALRIAAACGFNAEPLPAKTAWWLFPTYFVREMYGILEDWFLVK